jgi:hypothetical protein
MENLRITKVFVNDKNKDNVEFKTKAGKKYWKVAIQTDKYPNVWMSCLAFDESSPELKLQEGEERTLVIEDDGKYKNFKLPSKTDVLESRIKKLEVDVKAIIAKLNSNGVTSIGTKVPDFSEVDEAEEVNPDDIPF